MSAFLRLRKNLLIPHLLGFRSIVSSSSTKVLETFTEEFEIGSRLITLETGKIARFANGAVVLGIDETKVLSIVCSAKGDAILDYFLPPLTVDYDENIFANGLIQATRMRSGGTPKEREKSGGRIIHRVISMFFPPGFYHTVQVFASVLHWDMKQDPVVLAANATSAALMLSDIPWDGPIGVIRIGRIHGQFIVNPTMDELCSSDVNLIYVCTRDKTWMINVQRNDITGKDHDSASRLAHLEAVKYVEHQLRLAAKAGKSKKESKLSMVFEKVFTDPAYGKKNQK